MDESLKNEKTKRRVKQKLTEIYQKKQAFARQTKEMEIDIIDRVVPHISGDQGYP
jgi:hypothetical protein